MSTIVLSYYDNYLLYGENIKYIETHEYKWAVF